MICAVTKMQILSAMNAKVANSAVNAMTKKTESEGFEPSEERAPLAGLANRCLKPLGQLSRAEAVRFELTRQC